MCCAKIIHGKHFRLIAPFNYSSHISFSLTSNELFSALYLISWYVLNVFELQGAKVLTWKILFSHIFKNSPDSFVKFGMQWYAAKCHCFFSEFKLFLKSSILSEQICSLDIFSFIVRFSRKKSIHLLFAWPLSRRNI